MKNESQINGSPKGAMFVHCITDGFGKDWYYKGNDEWTLDPIQALMDEDWENLPGSREINKFPSYPIVDGYRCIDDAGNIYATQTKPDGSGWQWGVVGSTADFDGKSTSNESKQNEDVFYKGEPLSKVKKAMDTLLKKAGFKFKRELGIGTRLFDKDGKVYGYFLQGQSGNPNYFDYVVAQVGEPGWGKMERDHFDSVEKAVEWLSSKAAEVSNESKQNEGKNEVSNFSRDSLGVSFDGKFGNMRKGESWVVYPETLDKGYICIQGDTRFGYINVNKDFLVLSAPHSTPIYAALMVDINKGKAQRIPLEKEIVDQILNAVNDRTITDHSLDNVIRNADVTDDELMGESHKKSESLTLKQKELKDMARYGQAEDITTISDAEAKELKKKGIETVGISRGVYGMNGALLRDKDGNKYVITARSSNLFYFV